MAKVGHYSECGNELAKEYNKSRQKLLINAKEDNKAWAVIDFSLSEDEFETLHPKTAEKDMNKVKDYFEDIRDNFHYKPSESTDLLIGVAKNQQMFNENLVKHMKVLDNMNKTMKDIRKGLKNKHLYI